jgi:hypothetical protein
VAGERKLLKSSGDQVIDSWCRNTATYLSTSLGVSPSVCFYDEGSDDNANAEASAQVHFDGAADGTVMLGIRLLRMEWQRFPTAKVFVDLLAPPPIFIVIAHEFGHILQFKKKLPEAWQMEPHADFLAGWAIAHDPRNTRQSPYFMKELTAAASTIFDKGDILFNEPDHGASKFRSAMVEGGADKRSLDAEAAFRAGWAMANLPQCRFEPRIKC